MAETPNDLVHAHGNVRGTQSFVRIMAAIFKRPGLVAIEIAWRLVAWLPSLVLTGIALRALGMDIHFGSYAGSTPTAPFGWEALRSWFDILMHGGFIVGFQYKALLVSLALVLGWAVLCGFVRSIILRRLEPQLSANLKAAISLTILRVLAFLIFVGAWLWMLAMLWFGMVLRQDPSYVPAFALAVIGTLILFMLWSVVSWIFPLATTLAMLQRLSLAQSLRAAWHSGRLRSKLIEINLVMGIVKVCLLVLAMVFSACPLPFSNVATQQFLNWWWFGCFLFWVVSSDYFHVVRVAAVLRLTQAYTEA